MSSAPIFARTRLELIDKLERHSHSNGHSQPNVVLICNAPYCKRENPRLSPMEGCVLVLGEFRCMECFRKLVAFHPTAFGVSEKPTAAEIESVIRPYQPEPGERPFAANLYQPKNDPHLVLIF